MWHLALFASAVVDDTCFDGGFDPVIIELVATAEAFSGGLNAEHFFGDHEAHPFAREPLVAVSVSEEEERQDDADEDADEVAFEALRKVHGAKIGERWGNNWRGAVLGSVPQFSKSHFCGTGCGL